MPVIYCAFVVAMLAGCSPVEAKSAPPSARSPAPPAAFVTIDAPGGPLRFAVELAVTDPQRNKGMMFREHLAEDAGMLFLFEEQRPQSFWMKNTRIPLDMVFIAEGGLIVGIVESAEPLTLSPRRVDAPSRYVLELNGGASRKLGIAAGQRVRFEGVPPSLVDPGVLSGEAPR